MLTLQTISALTHFSTVSSLKLTLGIKSQQLQLLKSPSPPVNDEGWDVVINNTSEDIRRVSLRAFPVKLKSGVSRRNCLWHWWCDYTIKPKLVFSKSQCWVNFNGAASLQRAFSFPQTDESKGTSSFVFSFPACCITISRVILFYLCLLETSVSNGWALMSFPGIVRCFYLNLPSYTGVDCPDLHKDQWMLVVTREAAAGRKSHFNPTEGRGRTEELASS